VNLDWRRLKAVVLESDDWGLCAWSPDDQAFRVLADTPVFRSNVGARYGGSTLERAEDVREMVATLLEFRGGDGFPPVLQANTVVAAPDYVGLTPPGFEADPMPLVDFPATPSRWARPGLWGEISRAREAGVWWPELHGLHHLPERAWLTALRRGASDARRAHDQQSPVCQAVEGSGEYAAAEPIELRRRNLGLAVEKFTAVFGRPPGSFCPPDYQWDSALDEDAVRLGLSTFQGRSERADAPLPLLSRTIGRYRWPDLSGKRFSLPPRIAFEPSAGPREAARVGVEAVRRSVRAAWNLGQPAIVSTHRVNYVHLDAKRQANGLARLRDLLAVLVEDGAVFVTDAEVHGLLEHGWSERAIGARGALVRYYGVPRDPVRWPAPAGASGVSLREGKADDVDVRLDSGRVELRANVGEYLLEWAQP